MPLAQFLLECRKCFHCLFLGMLMMLLNSPGFLPTAETKCYRCLSFCFSLFITCWIYVSIINNQLIFISELKLKKEDKDFYGLSSNAVLLHRTALRHSSRCILSICRIDAYKKQQKNIDLIVNVDFLSQSHGYLFGTQTQTVLVSRFVPRYSSVNMYGLVVSFF